MSTMCYPWSKEFLEAGKRRLGGDTARERTSDEMKILRAELSALKKTLAELLMENRLLKRKRTRGWGGRYLRFSGVENDEITRSVEDSSLSVARTLAQLGIRRSTLDGCLKRY